MLCIHFALIMAHVAAELLIVKGKINTGWSHLQCNDLKQLRDSYRDCWPLQVSQLSMGVGYLVSGFFISIRITFWLWGRLFFYCVIIIGLCGGVVSLWVSRIYVLIGGGQEVGGVGVEVSRFEGEID